MRVGRNEACPCGSGKKSKHCCGDQAARKMPRGLIVAIAALVIVAAIGIVPAMTGSRNQAVPAAIPAPAATGNTPQPGAAPPGKVWSEEHGHWHDAETPAGAPTSSPIRVEQTTGHISTPSTTTVHVNTPAAHPQPPGPAPAGKVWSAEHGHWHDAPQQ